MASTYLPRRESELLSWSLNFSNYINSDPALYGLTLAQAAAYLAAQEAFTTAYQLVQDPITRSPGNIQAKNTLKAALIALTRQMVDICQAYPEMNNDKRVNLGITVRDNEPTPAPVPVEWPKLSVQMVEGRTFYLQLRNQEDKKAKPEGARAAWLYLHVGENPSPNLGEWQFKGESTRSDPIIVLPEGVGANTMVYFTALWVNTTGKTGPACAPVQSYTNHFGLNQAA